MKFLGFCSEKVSRNFGWCSAAKVLNRAAVGAYPYSDKATCKAFWNTKLMDWNS